MANTRTPGFKGKQVNAGPQISAVAMKRRAIREEAQKLLDSPEYQASLVARIKAGTLPPALETLIWHYAHGRPVERTEVSIEDNTSHDLTSVDGTELMIRAELLLSRLKGLQPTPSQGDIKPS